MLGKRRIPSFHAFLIQRRRSQIYRIGKEGAKADAALELAMQAIIEAATSKGFAPKRRFWLEMVNNTWALSNSANAKYGAALVKAMKGKDGLDPWARAICEGQWRLADAWAKRGTGYVDSVSESAWKGFEQALSEAAIKLQEAWSIDSSCPEAAAGSITVAMGASENRADLRKFFECGIAAQFDYRPLYDKLMLAQAPALGR